MAKFTPSAIVGRISGSVHSETYSRNRYGAYVRARTVPTNPNTSYQQAIRNIMATESARFQGLGPSYRRAWNTYAQNNPIRDKLGETQTLTGHVAFVGINSRLTQAGDPAIDAPPVVVAPTGLTTMSITVDVGVGDSLITFTPTPLGAEQRMFMKAAVVDSAGINYVKNLMKLIAITGKGFASTGGIHAQLTLRFGTLSVGQKVVLEAMVFDCATGLLSTSLQAETIVVST